MNSKTNFHTHTTRCKHADGADRDYVLAAIENGFTTLGFSDHGPFPFGDGYTSRIRMTMDELDGYLASITALRDAYRDQINIKIGFEYECFPAFVPFLKSLLADTATEYLLLGNHFDGDERTGIYFGGSRKPAEIHAYAARTIEGLETGLYACLAHPDLFLFSYPSFDKEAKAVSRSLCKAAKRLGIPLEYNLYGVIKKDAPGLGYPYLPFWEIAAEEGCDAIIGTDAHWPDMLASSVYGEAIETLAGLGIHRVSSLQSL